jgi:putative hydrolase of the HAD superfamily
VSTILLLDLDHTLYPSTAPTLTAVDSRITRFIETRLALPFEQADQLRRDLCVAHGTTLRGLEILHGVSRDEYTDFIQDLADHLMPAPDPELRGWLLAATRRRPTYLFTNARRDWARRCLAHLGLSDLLGDDAGTMKGADVLDARVSGAETAPRSALAGVFDIDFMGWEGKPNPEAFARVERHLDARHPGVASYVFADDRLDNLAAAHARGWRTVWVRPHDAKPDAGAFGSLGSNAHRIVDRLTDLDPEAL